MNLLDNLDNKLWKSKNVIYCYTNNINNKKYIGQTIQSLRERHRKHMSPCGKYDKDVPFHRAIRKYGINNFTLEIIHFAKSLDELNYFESLYIKYYNTTVKNNLGYNVKDGGSNGGYWKNKTEEEINDIKRKMSENHADFSGENNYNYGKRGELSHLYGIPRTEETRKKISNSKKGTKRSEESRRKQSENHADFSGENNPNYNNHKLKGGNHPKCKKVYQYDLDGNLIKAWNYAKEISETYSTLRAVLQGKRKTYEYKGFIWKYFELDTKD